MQAGIHFPDVEPGPRATAALVGLAVVLWIQLRLWILRRQLARAAGQPPGPGVTRLRFLHALAAWHGTNLLLALCALACLAVLALDLLG